ncbi:MAG: glucose-6-phosphate isomerase [Deltaproteobacteria bacterium]|nr:glucose-6-phosphate isomerase [Deltaproteobacteria bacterium]
MKSKQPLTIDLNNFFKPLITDGLDPVASYEEEFSQIHSGIKTLKQTGNLPYAKLSQDDAMRDNVTLMAGRYQQYDNVVVLGIGGSALGASSLYYAIKGPYANYVAGTQKKSPRLFVVDHIEAQTIGDLFNLISADKNLFVVISKSGSTSETLAQYLLVKKFFANIGRENFLFITDPQKGLLRDLVVKENYASLVVPPGVGGRFSVFSPVGLFPLAACGVDITALLDGVEHMEQLCLNDRLAQNPAGLVAVTCHQWLKRHGVSEIVMMPYSERLHFFSDWFAQLWGESLGKMFTLKGEKKFTGSTPVKSVGVTDQHSQLQLYLEGPRNKVVVFVEVENTDYEGHLGESNSGDERLDFLSGQTMHKLMSAEKAATEESLRENNRPNATIKMSMINEFQLGQLYQLFMNVVPYMGALLDINPFDQPAVEKIKKFTFGLLGRKGFEDFADKLKAHKKDKGLVF